MSMQQDDPGKNTEKTVYRGHCGMTILDNKRGKWGVVLVAFLVVGFYCSWNSYLSNSQMVFSAAKEEAEKTEKPQSNEEGNKYIWSIMFKTGKVLLTCYKSDFHQYPEKFDEYL